ncbi:MAG TPA: M4 family metallopeptidase [Noviherbaspirillum sp.]|nr:M4 family metallopeptidase [Noviherbaspirillum sp.]
MCRHVQHHFNPIFCIVPPHVLDGIANNGTPKQRAAALRTKSADNTFRALRMSRQSPQGIPAQPVSPRPLAELKPMRTIYHARNQQNLPGEVIRLEGGEPVAGDDAANEAYEGLGATYTFFADVFGRDSIDDAGMQLDAVVHFGDDYNNAFWNSVQMVFGDGDGELFNRFTISLDVIGHELAHGVIEDEAQLQYLNQPGALNESLADVFGSMVRQYHRKESVKDATWLIGDGLFAGNVNGVALRSMKDPGSAFNDPVLGKDPQPKHMDDFVNTFSDNGGVHINSGIPNHAFYQVAMALGGYSWEKAGRIWYDALCDQRVRPNTGFVRFARITADIAGRRYGVGSKEQQAVRAGWAAVGIGVQAADL